MGKEKVIEVRVGRDYFGSVIPCADKLTAISLINLVPSLHIRVEFDKQRFLLKPEENGYRVVDGCTDLYTLYTLFNDVRHHKYAAIGIGPNSRLYHNRLKHQCNPLT